MVMKNEYIFHFSVAKWLHLNGYVFFYEASLPHTSMRPDFFVATDKGEKIIAECKLDIGSSQKPVLDQMKKYLKAIDDTDVKGWLLFPEGTALRDSFIKRCDQDGLKLVFIPLENPMPFEYMKHSLYGNTIGKYFPSFLKEKKLKPAYTPVINTWGRFLLS